MGIIVIRLKAISITIVLGCGVVRNLKNIYTEIDTQICATRLFLWFSFPCSTDHERDWPPCNKMVFRVGNQYAGCEKQQQQQRKQKHTQKHTLQILLTTCFISATIIIHVVNNVSLNHTLYCVLRHFCG